ncbi:MAG: hypothetical protein OEU09_11015 [Rhodospirillales bacterium]|nr:hypothetical protein [Rhodospirillales bacterium]MDH3790213.1 hypothetical protein [Rhodospirillales bacterium]MDH3911820.1 hypothetical protein [Rhodospirillales bacterium]MDH3920556.1 hypothetical protein [Rhodospirillales bacterium]MDH3966504.1 hypothetical protein [Rhodospirillales bacterium]
MTDETVMPLERFQAPYGRAVELLEVRYESGMCLLRVRIREGSRFTILDLDPSTAAHWGGAMSAWAERTGSEGP